MKNIGLRQVVMSIICNRCRRKLMGQSLQLRPLRRVSDLDELQEYQGWLKDHTSDLTYRSVKR